MKVVARTKEQDVFEERAVMLRYLDYHLRLLSEAVRENDSEEKAFQISQLQKVRSNLIRLGYFREERT